jgi:DNA primase
VGLAAVCRVDRSLNISAMAGILPVATRFYGRRFVNGREQGRLFYYIIRNLMKLRKLSTLPTPQKEKFNMATWVDFNAVKQAVPIEQAINHYGMKLKRTGKELHGRCPIHNGKGEESFRANTEKNAFQCFSCQAKGNVLDFVAAMEKCSVRDAGLKLQTWFGLAPGRASDTKGSSASATGSELARKERAGEEGSSTSEGANGGETEPNKPLGFQLRGVDHGHTYLAGRDITKETAEPFGVGFFGGKGSMSGRVVIPIHNQAGELVAYAGRAIGKAEPRYKLPAGFHKSMELYNLHRAIATGQRGLIVVEGFFDCMKVHQAGYPFVVALMGCSMSEEQERLLVANAEMVLLMLDGDEAGQKGTDEIMLRLGRKVWVKSVCVPDGKQPDQMTAQEINELLKK